MTLINKGTAFFLAYWYLLNVFIKVRESENLTKLIIACNNNFKEIHRCLHIIFDILGRGTVVLSFASPRKAQLFLSNAKQAKESALYLSVKDLQKFSFDDKRDKVM